jgi:hypothetical protein
MLKPSRMSKLCRVYKSRVGNENKSTLAASTPSHHNKIINN